MPDAGVEAARRRRGPHRGALRSGRRSRRTQRSRHGAAGDRRLPAPAVARPPGARSPGGGGPRGRQGRARGRRRRGAPAPAGGPGIPVSGNPSGGARPAGGGATATAAVRGAGWVTAGIASQRVIQTGALLLLARLLVPEDFGLVAVAMLVLSFAMRAKSLGLQTALVQYGGDVGTAADSALILNAGITVAVLAVIVLISPLASAWFEDPRAGLILVVMSLRLIPQAVAAVPSALAVKALKFRKVALITVAESVTTAAVAVTLAFHGLGAWSLVAGSLAGAVLSAVLWWLPPMWRPSLRMNRDVLGELLGTGVRIWSSGNLAYAIDSANRLFMGRFLGVPTLGLYDVVSRFVHTPLQSLLGVSDRVALPAYCREQADRKLLGRWVLRVTGLLMLVTTLVAGTLFFYADILVPVLIGSRWVPVVAPIRVLTPLVLLFPLLSMAPVYIAVGRTGLLLRFTAVRAVVTIAALYWASHQSLVAVCAVESASVALFALVNLWLVLRILDLGVGQLLRSLVLPAAG
ncbi:MAG TPA: lipopolysaccharide biosynthesis protein, partial [Acidobacteria bacterium]|nr:lipopolysaccharide biosynthesis protein [Acidobacteriota bacterium]